MRVRRDLRLWLKELQRELGFTAVFVTHDQEEALDLADRICVMQGGRILQTATADVLYSDPANAAVFRFMSDVHEWPAEARGQVLDLGSIAANVWVKADCRIPVGKGTLAIRNQELALAGHPVGGVQMPVSVKRLDMLGSQYRLTVSTEGWGKAENWHLLLPLQSLAGHLPEIGKRCYLAPSQAYFITADDGRVHPLFHDIDSLRRKVGE